MEIIILITIALTLSMDAFSLSLAYGTLNFKQKEINILSIIVGAYHFFMPLLGIIVGSLVTKYIQIGSNLIIFCIFFIIGIQMVIESIKNDKEIKKLKYSQMLLFGLAVSIDSFSVGIGLSAITDKFIIASFIFSITSFTFTYIGLKLGKYVNEKIGSISTMIGGLILIVLAVLYLLK